MASIGKRADPPTATLATSQASAAENTTTAPATAWVDRS
jgi:hypothetical protein